jgi:hypothetical protein
MTTFEEELSSLPVSQSTKYTEYWNKAQLLTVFKDWQPQQALPVVPELTQKQADTLNDYKNGSGSLVNYLSTEIKKRDYDYFARAWLDGYTVEKPQLFYLKNKLTGAYLYFYEATNLYSDIVGNIEDFFGTKTKFTQEEIDNMQTGSYEKIEVTE